MGKYTDYIMKTAQDLLSVPSPSGFTHMAADFVKKEFEKEFLDVCERKNKEQLDALKAGKFDDAITGVLEATAKELSAKYA